MTAIHVLPKRFRDFLRHLGCNSPTKWRPSHSPFGLFHEDPVLDGMTRVITKPRTKSSAVSVRVMFVEATDVKSAHLSFSNSVPAVSSYAAE